MHAIDGLNDVLPLFILLTSKFFLLTLNYGPNSIPSSTATQLVVSLFLFY